MTVISNSILDDILHKYEGRRRDALLPALWDIQTTMGYIDAESVRGLSYALRVPESDIYGVIGFYTLFHNEPTGRTIIRVCASPICGLAGSDKTLHELCDKLGLDGEGTTADGAYTIEHTHCLGLCEHAPSALISQRGEGEILAGHATDADALLNGDYPPYESITGGNPQVLLKGVHDTHRETLEEYGDYDGLARGLEELSQEELIDIVEQSGLIGRGGAAFPTGMKWKFTRQSPATPRYVVCNADESEPGTFKDRVLLENRPHLVLEGMAICGYAIGAEKGFIFVRGEYPEVARRLEAAIAEAEAAGWLGENIMGTGFSFHVEVRRGAGAYICGEETALFEAIEGKRGFPRIKPPFPTTHGLFGKPTTINNVETLSAVPGIVANGADWFRSLGTEKSTGSKLVSVSGHVRRAGVYEISPGISLRQLLDDHCQGVTGTLQAVLMGGAAGSFLTPDEIDVPLTFEDLREIGSTFGSGAVMVFNQTADIRDVCRRLANFFQHESCGKCFPCQLGTQRQKEILARQVIAGDFQRLQDIGWTMTEASLCGLGQTAAMAILSAMKKFPERFQEGA